MPDRRKIRARGRPHASLLSPEAAGGITAGRGFDFQTRYAACHLPVWMARPGFHQLLFEGTGDIDIRFVEGGSSSRTHIQVKDHEVSPAELKAVVEQFARTDSDMPGVYERFTLACPSLSATLRPVEAALARFRGAKPFYDDIPQALDETKHDLNERLRASALADHVALIESKVYIDVGHGDLRHDDRAVELFIARLLSLPEYSGKLRAMVQPAFAQLMRLVSARRGVVLERSEIETLLQTAVNTGEAERKGVTIWIHNWTSESFDRPADYVLDWSSYFDRGTRRVPPKELWERELVPALLTLRQRIASDRRERLIRFRGKCALSTGLALGASFPAVGAWVFEIPQPPSQHDWRSDAVPTAPYQLRTDTVEGDGGGTDLVLGLNIKADAREDVARYMESTGTRPRLYAFVSPLAQGGQAIGGSEDACALALAVRNHLGELLKKYRLGRTHLFYYGPFALAVFLGQQLTSIGEVHLYEYQDPGYVQSCMLRT